jgi:serine/threonine/tyrosine-interacting protein
MEEHAPSDWRYEMRREMQEIVKGLFVGPYSCARNIDLLRSKQITHMLCIRDITENHIIKQHFPTDFNYYILDVSDRADSNLIPFFHASNSFIFDALAAGGKVFVYCNNGISRSPSVVICYLMQHHALSYKDAFSNVMQKRFCINPNACFKFQLSGYESM